MCPHLRAATPDTPHPHPAGRAAAPGSRCWPTADPRVPSSRRMAHSPPGQLLLPSSWAGSSRGCALASAAPWSPSGTPPSSGGGGGWWVPLQPQVPPSCFPLLLPLNCSLALTDLLPLSLPGELSDCKAVCWPHARSHACSHAWGCCLRAPPCFGPRGQQRQRSWSLPAEPSPLTAPTSLGGLLFQALIPAQEPDKTPTAGPPG